MAIIKKTEIASVGEDVEKPLYTAVRNVQWCGHCGKQCGVSSEIINRTTKLYSNSTSGNWYKRIENKVLKKYVYSHIH